MTALVELPLLSVATSSSSAPTPYPVANVIDGDPTSSFTSAKGIGNWVSVRVPDGAPVAAVAVHNVWSPKRSLTSQLGAFEVFLAHTATPAPSNMTAEAIHVEPCGLAHSRDQVDGYDAVPYVLRCVGSGQSLGSGPLYVTVRQLGSRSRCLLLAELIVYQLPHPQPPRAPPSPPSLPAPPTSPPLPPLVPPRSPPLPPVRILGGYGDKVAELNRRFRTAPFDAALWRANGPLANAAILAHVFDGWEDHHSMYRATGDQSGSLVYRQQGGGSWGGAIPFFHSSGGGIILRPHATHLLCGKGGDSGGHCGGEWSRWCPSVTTVGDVTRYSYPGDGCGGSWRPADFGIFLERQAAWQVHSRRLDYNEIIYDGDAMVGRLPLAIDAFFYLGSKDVAANQHAQFVAEFGRAAADIPLVSVDLHNWDQPFRLG